MRFANDTAIIDRTQQENNHKYPGQITNDQVKWTTADYSKEQKTKSSWKPAFIHYFKEVNTEQFH